MRTGPIRDYEDAVGWMTRCTPHTASYMKGFRGLLKKFGGSDVLDAYKRRTYNFWAVKD